MSQVAQQLDTIVEKTERLIELCAALQEENDLLKLENQSLTTAFNASKDKSKELEDKMRVLKVAKSFSETSEKTLDIKQKIDEFVQEIDKCIVLLKK
jgi:regulator of replication initiation timing